MDNGSSWFLFILTEEDADCLARLSHSLVSLTMTRHDMMAWMSSPSSDIIDQYITQPIENVMTMRMSFSKRILFPTEKSRRNFSYRTMYRERFIIYCYYTTIWKTCNYYSRNKNNKLFRYQGYSSFFIRLIQISWILLYTNGYYLFFFFFWHSLHQVHDL